MKASPDVANCPTCQAGLTGGLMYAGADGNPSYAFIPKKADFQPRVGVAYRVKQRLVLRGGYVLSYLGQNSNGPQTGYSQSTSLVSSLDGGIAPAVTLSDPYPASIFPNGLLKPIGNTQGLATNLGQAVSFHYLDRPYLIRSSIPPGSSMDCLEIGFWTCRTWATRPGGFPSAWD